MVRCFSSISVHTAYLGQQKDIIVHDIPDLKYKLLLFVGSETIELEKKDNRTWEPVQRLYVLRLLIPYTHINVPVYREISPTSQVRVEILLKSSHLPWVKKDQNIKAIDLQKLFNDYWSSKEHNLMVPGRSRSPTSPLPSDGNPQRSWLLENTVALLKYVSLRALRFVSLQLSIGSS